MTLRSADDLRTVYRPAGGPAVNKVVTNLDQHCVDFLSMSPFFVLSSSNGQGVCDGSPKGGEPGFVEALDDTRVAWADFSGNNRLDSFENIVENPSVGLLFLIPGMDETLRINGRAELSTDPELCTRFAVTGKPAKVVVVVTIDEAYLHCAKALRRAALWDTEHWPGADALPSAACIFRDHAALDLPPEVIDQAIEQDTAATLWEPGGDPG